MKLNRLMSPVTNIVSYEGANGRFILGNAACG